MKKKSDSVQEVARVIKVQSNAGGRREEEEENQREKEEERSKNRKRGPEERGKESGKTIARFTNKVKHRGRDKRSLESSQDHKVLPKLPVEGKGVWPRLVRWNGVTPGR